MFSSRQISQRTRYQPGRHTDTHCNRDHGLTNSAFHGDLIDESKARRHPGLSHIAGGLSIRQIAEYLTQDGPNDSQAEPTDTQRVTGDNDGDDVSDSDPAWHRRSHCRSHDKHNERD